MPDTAGLQKAYGQPGAQKPGCGFPVAHLLALFDARDGTLARAVPAPLRTHDMAHAALTHDGTMWRLYLDGKLEAEIAVGRLPQAASTQHAGIATATVEA